MFNKAKETRKNSNETDNDHKIGAAALGESGKIYGGCNLLSIPQDYCAERVALFNAISSGEKKIKAIMVTCNKKRENSKGGPCGICLHALSTLSNNPELLVYVWYENQEEQSQPKTLKELYPFPYVNK
jgi:cytidine deaminase